MGTSASGLGKGTGKEGGGREAGSAGWDGMGDNTAGCGAWGDGGGSGGGIRLRGEGVVAAAARQRGLRQHFVRQA